MPFATHFPNDDQPPWHLSFLEFIGLVINYQISTQLLWILFIIEYKVLYMSSCFWLLGVESRDFSHAEKERTAR